MLWLILCIVTAALYAVSGLLDNYITDIIFKNKKPQAMKIFNGCFYLVASVCITAFFGLQEIELDTIALIFLAGVIASTSSIPYYSALKDEEATGAAIYYQLQPLIYLGASVLIFHEDVKIAQLAALALFIAAPIIITVTRQHKKSRQRAIKSGMFFLVYVTLLAVSGIMTTRIGTSQDIAFTTLFAYYLLGRGVTDMVLAIIFKSWRQRFSEVAKKTPVKLFGSLLINQTICLVAEIAFRYALIIGVTAVVAAVANSLELILVFLLGIFLTIKWPQFGREKLHKHIIVAHLIAVVLCIIGIIIMEIA